VVHQELHPAGAAQLGQGAGEQLRIAGLVRRRIRGAGQLRPDMAQRRLDLVQAEQDIGGRGVNLSSISP